MNTTTIYAFDAAWTLIRIYLWRFLINDQVCAQPIDYIFYIIIIIIIETKIMVHPVWNFIKNQREKKNLKNLKRGTYFWQLFIGAIILYPKNTDTCKMLTKSLPQKSNFLKNWPLPSAKSCLFQRSMVYTDRAALLFAPTIKFPPVPFYFSPSAQLYSHSPNSQLKGTFAKTLHLVLLVVVVILL